MLSITPLIWSEIATESIGLVRSECSVHNLFQAQISNNKLYA